MNQTTSNSKESGELEALIDEAYAQRGRIPVPDPRNPSDPMFTEMVRVSGLPDGKRNEAVEPFLREWLEQNMDPLSVARYLSAAGLSRAEAENIQEVVTRRSVGALRLEAYSNILGGLILFAAGAWVAVDRVFPFWGLVFMAVSGIGAFSIFRGLKMHKRFGKSSYKWSNFDEE